MISNIKFQIQKGYKILKRHVILDKNEKKFINLNNKIWNSEKKIISKKVILLDLILFVILLRKYLILKNKYELCKVITIF